MGVLAAKATAIATMAAKMNPPLSRNGLAALKQMAKDLADMEAKLEALKKTKDAAKKEAGEAQKAVTVVETEVKQLGRAGEPMLKDLKGITEALAKKLAELAR